MAIVNKELVLPDYIDAEADMEKVLGLVYQYGGIDGEDHKDWLLDRIVRAITGENYEQFVSDYEEPFGADEDYYEWKTGVAL